MTPSEPADLSPLMSGEEWKEKANNFYKDKEYRKAIDAYSNAIEFNPENALYYLNRAAASLMLFLFRDAITDCDKVILLNFDKITNAKAYFRKVTAFKGLGKLDGVFLLFCYI